MTPAIDHARLRDGRQASHIKFRGPRRAAVRKANLDGNLQGVAPSQRSSLSHQLPHRLSELNATGSQVQLDSRFPHPPACPIFRTCLALGPLLREPETTGLAKGLPCPMCQ